MLSSTANPCAALGKRAAPFAVAFLFTLAALMPPHADAEPPRHKLPLPDNAAQQKAIARVRDAYSADYNSDKAALAEKLIQKAKETQDPTDRLALLWEAKNVAAEAFQRELAFEVIDEIASRYDISAAQAKADIVKQAAKAARTVEQKRSLAEAALLIVDDAIAEDNFEIAKTMIRGAGQLIRVKEIATKNKELEAASKAYAEAKEAMDTLKTKPNDPDANLSVGKYLCLVKGDWDNGLSMLKKSDNTKWKALAERDMKRAEVPADQLKLGDAWWGISKTRAIYWYKQALPGLLPAQREKIRKRLIVLPIEKVVIWNQHMAGWNDRGTKICNIALLRGRKEVWRTNGLQVPWEAYKDTFLSVRVPQVSADILRVEIVQWYGKGGGMSEAQVFVGANSAAQGCNIALGCRVTASARFSDDFSERTLTDGVTTSAADKSGYWLLPDGKKGWAEIHLIEKN
jgi:hypothetical protein